jgi:hypothetical protein
MELPPLYVSYAETSGTEGLFVYLPDSQAAAIAVETRSQKLCRVTRIQKISKQPDQPAIEILCFTSEPLSPERSREIAQNAVDWLMEEGYLEWKE